MNPPAAELSIAPQSPEESPEEAVPEEVMVGVAQQAIAMARALPAPLRRVSIRCGEVAVEIDWHRPVAAVPGPDVGAALEPSPDPIPLGEVVPAPLVGTFFRAPAPGAEPFVQVGSTVEAGQTLAIVEAMKLMNPIVSQVSGRVAEVLVNDGEAVQFDQPLIRIVPDGDPGGPEPVVAG